MQIASRMQMRSPCNVHGRRFCDILGTGDRTILKRIGHRDWLRQPARGTGVAATGGLPGL